MAFITPEQAAAHLRADSTEDLSLYIGAAELSATEFLGRQVYADSESMAAAVLAGTAGDDPMVVNDLIKAAMLLILGHLYRNREEVVTAATVAVAQIPMGAHSLLQPYRTGMGV